MGKVHHLSRAHRAAIGRGVRRFLRLRRKRAEEKSEKLRDYWRGVHRISNRGVSIREARTEWRIARTRTRISPEEPDLGESFELAEGEARAAAERAGETLFAGREFAFTAGTMLSDPSLPAGEYTLTVTAGLVEVDPVTGRSETAATWTESVTLTGNREADAGAIVSAYYRVARTIYKTQRKAPEVIKVEIAA